MKDLVAISASFALICVGVMCIVCCWQIIKEYKK